MGALEIIIICVLVLWVISAIAYIVYCKVTGKRTCGFCNGDCSECTKKKTKKERTWFQKENEDV